MPNAAGKQITRAAVYAIVSALLYLFLYLYEVPILAWSARGGWYFLLPVAIAFLFSYVHGNFTAQFWDVLGIRARK